MEKVTYAVHNMSGKEVGSIELSPEVFGAPLMPELVHQAVRWQRAKKRSGTHSTLTRSTMKGGGKKPWKQKGTGRARSGTNKSTIWVGGAVAFGPQPRKYDFRFPKRARRQALASVLTDKVTAKNLRVLEDLSVKSPKTKEMVKMLSGLGCATGGVMVVLAGENEGVAKSLRNIPNVSVLPVAGLNVFDLMKHSFVISTKDGIKAITARITGEEA